MKSHLDTKILISVGNESIRWLIAELLRDKGYRNIELIPSDGFVFLETYRPGECGLIIVNASGGSSRMSGVTLLSEVRKRDADTRFLVVSGNSLAFVQEWWIDKFHLDLGDYTFLAMPFQPNDLFESVIRALTQ